MKRTSLPLLALAASLSCGAEISALIAQPAEPPPPVYTGPTPAAKPAAANPEPATSAPPPSAPPQSGSNNLEKLAMPIALHPDPIIAIILPASAYPLEIVQAARFVRDTNNISKLDEQSWDENVKAVARFPQVIAMMDADLPWTMALGQAFIDQPKELMDTIQSLRAKAHKAGTLRSSDQQVVTVTNMVIVQTNVSQVVTVTNQIVQVQPSNPQVVYVPSYPPTVYYPPPAYVYNPIAPLVTFGAGMVWGAAIANNCNWGHGEVDVNVNQNVNVNRTSNRETSQSGNRSSTTGAKGTQKWQPDQSRRSSSAPASTQSRDARGWGGAGNQASQGPGGGARPSQQPGGGGGARPSTQPSQSGQRSGASARPTTSQAGARSSGAGQQPSVNRSSPSGGGGSRSGSSSAFSGTKSGGGARDFSSRGSSSRGGGGGGSRGGGGGGRR